MEDRWIGVVLIALGALAILIGLLVFTGALSWFGRLPGDIRIEREHTRVYIPLTSMVVTSVGLSLLVALFRRLF